MSSDNTRRIYMLVRTVSNNDTKPEIKAACTLLPHVPFPLYSTYDWFEAEATDGNVAWAMWAGIPHESGASCRIISCSDASRDLLHDTMGDIAEAVNNVEILGDRFGELDWEFGEGSSGEGTYAYMKTGDTDAIFHDEDDNGEEYILWDIVHVDASAS